LATAYPHMAGSGGMRGHFRTDSDHGGILQPHAPTRHTTEHANAYGANSK